MLIRCAAPKGGSTAVIDPEVKIPPAFREAKRVMDEERGTAKNGH